MRRGLAPRALGAAGVVALSLIAVAPRADASDEKVSYCHRSDSVGHPYELHTTDADSIIKEGHGAHTGPVFPGRGPDGKWGDIIPPFEYSGGHFPGLNWPGGSDVLNGGCAVRDIEVPPPEETTTTTTAGTTTTTTGTTTTTAPPPIESGPTTVPGSSTTVSESPTTGTTAPAATTTTTSTSTTVPGASTTTAGASTTVPGASTTLVVPSSEAGTTTPTEPGGTPITTPPTTAAASEGPPTVTVPTNGGELPQVEAIVVDPGPRIVVLGTLSDAERAQLHDELLGRLAHTGSNDSQYAVLGVIALILGAALVVFADRRRSSSQPAPSPTVAGGWPPPQPGERRT